MPDLLIQQAIVVRARDGWEIAARSPGWRDDWLADVERICTGFGAPPASEHVPHSVFAQPLGRDFVAVFQAATEGTPPRTRFHVLTIPNTLYRAVGDPFGLAEHFPPPWDARVVLPDLVWVDEAPDRSIERVQRILQEDDSATLLGGAQAIVDGGRLVFERPFPATDLLRRLWALLPDSTRAEVWPASFVYSPALDWQVAVVERYVPSDWPGFLTEAQAGDYPESRYELNLQIAVESGDQRALNRLFARRTSKQTLRLAIMILIVATGAAVLSKLL
jgi:hypothetical protein